MRLVGMFAKFWEPGRVKTRLGAGVGLRNAALLHKTFVRTLLERLKTSADSRWMCFAPPEAHNEFAALAEPAWNVCPQAEGDLGARMHKFFESAFASGAEHVVLIGSDSPDLPLARIDQAFDSLLKKPVVLGPSTDGGYYLIGARNEPPPIFQEIPWSTEEVWNQTLSQLKKQGLQFTTLPPWSDVDTIDDLRRLNTRLQVIGGADSTLNMLKTRVEDILKKVTP